MQLNTGHLTTRTNRTLSLLLFVAFVLTIFCYTVPSLAQERASSTSAAGPDSTAKGAPYVPSPTRVTRKLLQLAEVSPGDVVYDLGSGDGRIVIMAAKEFGARGVGVEIDSQLVRESRMNAQRAGVANRVEFRQGDLFETDLQDATVVTLYLWPDMNNKLRPKLQRQLNPGDRVVSHSFDIDGWPPDSTIKMKVHTIGADEKPLFRWVMSESMAEADTSAVDTSTVR